MVLGLRIFLDFLVLVGLPELKAQVSFSDRPLSIVCLSVRLSLYQTFTFSTFSPEP
jgi:hypothetical protein